MKKMAAILAGLMMMAAGSAWATPTLQFFDGSTTVTVADGSAQDANSLAGVVTFIGSIGNWALNVSTGTTKPFQGSAFVPYLDLNTVNSTNINGGTIEIKFSETDFIGNSAVTGFHTGVGGTTQGIFSLSSYYDTNNTLFGEAGALANLGPFSPIAFSGEDTNSASILDGQLYSLTLEANITHSGQGTTSFDAQLTPVPEPGTIVLLGAGLLGLGFYGRRRMQK